MKELNKRILELWEKDGKQARVPALYPELKKHTLLFIGLNPSLSEKGIKNVMKNEDENEWILNDLFSFFNYKDLDEIKSQKLIEFRSIMKHKYSYFKKFKEISCNTGIDWEHIDLFYSYETNQKLIEKSIHSGFYQEQLEITLDIIHELNSKIIVVENAFASKLIKDKLNLCWDESIGTYRLNNSTPIFLSSMLTGQRSLDIGSLERLIWHINKVNSSLEITFY